MLSCGHEKPSFGEPMCSHLREQREPWLQFFRYYVGRGLDFELMCLNCATDRERGLAIDVDRVCEECFERATQDVGEVVGVRGKPEIRSKPQRFEYELVRTELPAALGPIADIAPIEHPAQSSWLLLTEDYCLVRFDSTTGKYEDACSVSVGDLKTHFGGRKLHVSRRGEFAAIVLDRGKYGEVFDLVRGLKTATLSGGEYHPDTVPFSFAFAEVAGRTVAIHRTDWNRLDALDPATGGTLTDRGPTSYKRGEQQPQHYLDYFHGRLKASPNGTRIFDDGWVWHPFGVPVVWSLERWLSQNVWESEDGPTRVALCDRAYFWNRGGCWVDETRFALAGIGDDDERMIDGARIFDTTKRVGHETWGRARELMAFAGPAGDFFSDCVSLYSSDKSGLSRWSLEDGARTGHLPDFHPIHYHSGANELVQLVDRQLIRLRLQL